MAFMLRAWCMVLLAAAVVLAVLSLRPPSPSPFCGPLPFLAPWQVCVPSRVVLLLPPPCCSHCCRAPPLCQCPAQTGVCTPVPGAGSGGTGGGSTGGYKTVDAGTPVDVDGGQAPTGP